MLLSKIFLVLVSSLAQSKLDSQYFWTFKVFLFEIQYPNGKLFSKFIIIYSYKKHLLCIYREQRILFTTVKVYHESCLLSDTEGGEQSCGAEKLVCPLLALSLYLLYTTN